MFMSIWLSFTLSLQSVYGSSLMFTTKSTKICWIMWKVLSLYISFSKQTVYLQMFTSSVVSFLTFIVNWCIFRVTEDIFDSFLKWVMGLNYLYGFIMSVKRSCCFFTFLSVPPAFPCQPFMKCICKNQWVCFHWGKAKAKVLILYFVFLLFFKTPSSKYFLPWEIPFDVISQRNKCHYPDSSSAYIGKFFKFKK